jgi:hypothetical protein
MSSIVVLNRNARLLKVSPVWAVYSTNSPGEYTGLSVNGIGGKVGVVVFKAEGDKPVASPAGRQEESRRTKNRLLRINIRNL